MNSKLRPFHSQLNSLRYRRLGVRLGNGFSTFLLAVLWSFILVFLVDWMLEMDRTPRVAALVLLAAIVIWAFRRYAWPCMRFQEDEVELALLVQRQHGIDSDLVAGLQFESSETSDAARRGSPQLQTAVVDRVAELAPRLNVYEGVSYDRFLRCAGMLALTVALLVAGGILFPRHLACFADRLLLGSAHYPTDTVIERIAVNGQVITPHSDADSPIRVPYGKPLTFDVQCSGVTPRSGTVTLQSEQGASETDVTLKTAGGVGGGNGTTVFSGALPRIVNSVTYQVFLGDAWTDARSVRVIPLPLLSVDLQATPPKYAAAVERSSSRDAGRWGSYRQISVLEGSRVDLSVTCRNKALKRCWLNVAHKEFALTQTGADGRVWRLSGEDSPFAAVTESLTFQIQVEDADGLQLPSPVEGAIRLKSDRGPRVVAGVVTRRVVPTASPHISYGATDDYGLSRVQVDVQILHADGRVEKREQQIHAISDSRQPPRTLRGRYKLDLSPFGLSKGDEVKLTVQAFDYRGPRPAESNVSEPLVLHVTDREGILAGLLQTDEKSARQLDAIIQRELGIGGGR